MSKLNLNDGQFRPSIDGIENGKTSQVVGMNRILNFIQNNCNWLKGEVGKKANKLVNIVAGNGLQGGGDLTDNRTINVVSADDSITVGADNIKVNTYNGVDSTSSTRPASANAVKKLQDEKMPYTGGTFTGNVTMAGGKVITGSYNYGFMVRNKNEESVYALLAQPDGKLHVGYSNRIPIMLDAQNITVNGGFATTSQDLRGAIKELNDGKVNKAGDKMTGSLEMGDGNVFIGAHNYGYVLKNKLGNQEYLGFIDTGGTKGNLIIAGSNVDGVVIRNNTSINGIFTTNGISVINGEMTVKNSLIANSYFRLKDYYGDAESASFWYNKDQPGYPPKTLFIDTAQNLLVNKRKVLTEANSGMIREKLYSGILVKGTTVTFGKSIKQFDAIEILCGDQFFNIEPDRDIDKSDVVSTIFNSNVLLSPYPFFQASYYDTQGGTNGNTASYSNIMRMLSETQMKLVQVYRNGGVYSDGTAHLEIYGVKYSFGGKR